MPLVVKKCGCDCAQQKDACSGCSCENGLECRTRGGIYSLCGFAEYVLSIPPKRYRTRRMSGIRTQINYNDPSTCSSINDNISETSSGNCTYDRTTCAYTEGATTTQTSSVVGVRSATRCSHPKFPWETYADTHTSRSIPFVGGCHAFEGLGVETTSCSNREDLLDEDKDRDAIDRLLATAAWSGWRAYDPILCTDCCTALWQQRLTGITAAYQECEWRLHYATTHLNRRYQVNVDFETRQYGSSDEWTLLETRIVEFVGTGGEMIIPGASVTITQGYASRVRGCPARKEIPL